MKIIFPFIFSLFEWLAVIIWIIQENSIKWNKLKKYRKSPRNVTHWNMEYHVLYEDYRKSLGVGRKKIKMVCRVSGFGARQRSLFAECQDGWHSPKNFNFFKKNPLCRVPDWVALGKEFKKINKKFAECQIGGTRQRIFLKKSLFAECQAGWYSAKNLKKIKKYFAECQIEGTRERFFF